MAKGLIGRKLGMTQVFDEKGNVVPVTVLEAGPCVVTDLRTEEQHGYKAVQLGFGEVKEKALSKAEVGHVKKNGIAPHRTLMEFRDADLEVEVGASVAADLFSAGDRVKVLEQPAHTHVTPRIPIRVPTVQVKFVGIAAT